jgi:hypothetical protein
VRVVSETLQLDAAGACLYSYLLKAKPDGYSDGLCRACTPMLPPIAASLGTPFSRIITIPISIYRVIGMVIAFVGVATFNKSGTGATSILQAVIFSKPEAPVEERHTGSFLLLLRFLRSCAWCSCRCTRFSACGDDLQDPRHTGFSPHRSKYLGEQPFYMRLSGAGEGSLLLLLLCAGASLA